MLKDLTKARRRMYCSPLGRVLATVYILYLWEGNISFRIKGRWGKKNGRTKKTTLAERSRMSLLLNCKFSEKSDTPNLIMKT